MTVPDPSTPPETPPLPGEGEVQVIRKTRVRRDCCICAEPATKRVTFLHENARRNPASSGYGKDDISWCSDAEAFACDSHEREVENDPPRGMRSASIFTATNAFAHLFLYWREEKSK